MKTRIITLCLLLVAFTGINVSYAAFPVKNSDAIENTSSIATENSTTSAAADNSAVREDAVTAVNKAHHMSFFQKMKTMIHPDVEVVGGGPAWPGILSLIFGILAFSAFFALPFLLFSIGAVIFGAIGVGHGYSCRLLALIGLILGILALLALVA